MKKGFTILGLLLLTVFAFGQENTKKFEPAGKVFAKIFTNFSSTFKNNKSHNQFEIQRAYFGYKYQMSEIFSGKVNIDVGNPGVGKLQMTAYLKNAFLQYKHNNIKIQFGLIGMNQFHLQEKIWGKRYLAKSFQDEYKFGSSADLGAKIEYKFNKLVVLDATISNGEGYKSIEADSILKYGAGITVTPIESLNLRLYYDLMGTDTTQQNIALLVAYNTKKIQVGAELNCNLNYQMINNHNLNGVSIYGSYKLNNFRKGFNRTGYELNRRKKELEKEKKAKEAVIKAEQVATEL